MEATSADDFVDVRDEPRHVRRFENAWVRAYDVGVPSGDRTLFHRHTEDTLYVAVLATKVQEQALGEEEAPAMSIPPGIAVCRPHRAEHLIHRVSNRGTGPMRMIGAEVKASPPVVAAAALEAAHHELRFELPRLRAYAIELAPGATTGHVRRDFSGLLVGITLGCIAVEQEGARPRTQVFQPGHVSWQEGPLTTCLTNVGETPWSAILGEWR